MEEGASPDEDPAPDQGREGKGGKLEKSKGTGKDGKFNEGTGRQFLVGSTGDNSRGDVPDDMGGQVWMNEEGWVVDGRRRWSKQWFLRMVRAGEFTVNYLGVNVLLDELFCNINNEEHAGDNNEEHAGDDNEEHVGDVDGTDNTSGASTMCGGPTPDAEAFDDELNSEPPRKCGRPA